MIVDCHAHVIQSWVGSCGHPTRDIHIKYLQRMLAHTVASIFRARDGAPGDTRALLDPNNQGWSGLHDVDFRIGRNGQLEFTLEGEDYYSQYMPVGMQEIVAPPELMLAQMMYVGVDHAVLQAGGAYGAMTPYNSFAQLQYPAKFTGLIHVDEAMGGEPESLAEIDRAADLGLKGLYYNSEGFARHDFPWAMDDPKLDPLWDRLHARDLVLCAEIGAAPSYTAQGYIENMMSLMKAVDRFPRIRTHLAMGVPVRFFAGKSGWEIPEALLRIYKRDDVSLEVMFPITWGGAWDYPYREAHPLIRQLRDMLGAEKLLWGSDMPNVERFCTYRQSLDYVRRYCEFLAPREMDSILGGNAARLYRLEH
jgi:predicted TIM-barrel fold metal-dependent hydrolase